MEKLNCRALMQAMNDRTWDMGTWTPSSFAMHHTPLYLVVDDEAQVCLPRSQQQVYIGERA